ncbi:MAG TPA: malto-oligosyltrehalose synthase [Candidatus Dormibacteraeota bacterium]|nr:malto-oligosyltrehalose synthase [Candidatus Dormibacteraeota bacterium]
MTPRATYRVQLSSDFTFQQAADLSGYLQALGISHLYCSPVLQAMPGSTHGYDVVDPTHISDQLGGAGGLRQLLDALATRSIGVMIDIVPNHMATAGRANPWWWDLLAHGPSSRYADYFDVEWRPATALKDKVLLGVLGDRYGRELEAKALTLAADGDEVVVRYHEQEFPVAPGSLDGAQPEDVAADVDELDRLLERQHYRLAYWRAAQEELNYRRFFTVDQLIGLRVERPQVFADSHRVILELVADGRVDALRVDHIDGLRDPDAYLTRLRRAAPDAYIAVEKIVAAGEELPQLPVQGTTGYDFIAAVDGVFVDAGNEPALTALYHAFTGEALAYAEVARASKQHIIATELATDLVRLSGLMHDVCDADRHHRDRTQREVHEALAEFAIAMRVYRTYVTPDAPATEQDRAEVRHAIEESTRRRPDIDPELLAFIGDVVLLDRRGDAEAEFSARFQQFTPAVMAKGLEDTAFYRYNRLVSLNEVGGDPGTFGRTVEQFHDWCTHIAATRPRTMLTRTTHDTKRSADVRARINLLSEIPSEWEAAVRRWSEHNDRHRPHGYPDRNIEYLTYQTLVGAWPIDKDRLTQYLNKAAREAKVHTSWMSPVAAYEDALAAFVDAILSDGEFTSDFESFLGRTQIVALGRIASLAQTTLLLTCPGVPDVYQGSELWNLTLVDPDNRRPIDYTVRSALLDEVMKLGAEEVLARPDDGSPKLWLIARLLKAKAERPELFSSTDYRPLEATGAKARHALGFVRGRLLVLVPRLPAGLGGDWGDTEVLLPEGTWTNVLSGQRQSGGRVSAASLLERFPVAVMTTAS